MYYSIYNLSVISNAKILVSRYFLCWHRHACWPKFGDFLTCCRHVANMLPTLPAKPKTSRMILTSISVLDLFSIGMIVLITGWWITTFSAYWKSMLDIHHKLTCHQNKGSFVTGTTTKMWHLLNGILSRKDTEHVMTRYLVLEYLVYTGVRVIHIFQVRISCVIAYQVGYS